MWQSRQSLVGLTEQVVPRAGRSAQSCAGRHPSWRTALTAVGNGRTGTWIHKRRPTSPRRDEGCGRSNSSGRPHFRYSSGKTSRSRRRNEHTSDYPAPTRSRARTDNMALGALGVDGLRRRGPSVDDRPVREIELDRSDVICSRAMTSLATDRRVSRFGAGAGLGRRVAKITRLRDMTVQAPVDAVANHDRLAANELDAVRTAEGPPPSRSFGVVVIRQRATRGSRAGRRDRSS